MKEMFHNPGDGTQPSGLSRSGGRDCQNWIRKGRDFYLGERCGRIAGQDREGWESVNTDRSLKIAEM